MTLFSRRRSAPVVDSVDLAQVNLNPGNRAAFREELERCGPVARVYEVPL